MTADATRRYRLWPLKDWAWLPTLVEAQAEITSASRLRSGDIIVIIKLDTLLKWSNAARSTQTERRPRMADARAYANEP
jgi:hypothetical protein